MHPLFSSLLVGLMALPASAGTLLFSDNFNAPETVNFDTAPLTGRRGGSLANDVQLRSRAAQIQHLAGNMWRIWRAANDGRLRFHNVSDLTRFNWAAGATGATVLAEGGLRLEFDWLPLNSTDTNWIAVGFGVAAATDVAQIVNDAQTDFGVLLRHNGGIQHFDNGAATTPATTFPATYYRRHVVLEYALSSFADGSSVTANVWVNGTRMVTDRVFDLNNNGGALYFEMGSHVAGGLIDNLAVSTLAAGADTDGDGLPDPWEQSMTTPPNLTDLAASPADFDADGLSDLQEYELGQRTFPGLNPVLPDTDGDGLSDGAERTPTAPRLATDPTDSDSDDDGLNDNVESNSADYLDAASPGTNPNNVDTDGDNFPDGYEAQRGGNPMAAGTPPSNLPAGVSTGIVTDEASTGFSATETFTHKVAGQGAATINGVALDVLSPTATPGSTTWDSGCGGKSQVTNNPGQWVAATGNVTGTGNIALFNNFTYSGNGGTPHCSQSFILQGLEPGRPYEFRLFIRKWDNGTVRPSWVRFTNGAESKDVFVLEDRPGVMTGSGNNETAYYVNYAYTATAPTMTVKTTVPRIPAANGSFHMYGFSNRVTGPPADTDLDGISDFYENTLALGLGVLNPTPADFDNDGLTDVQEYNLFATYPALSPLDDDSDNDGLKDGPEIAGAGSRPPTNPTDADSDDDTLDDYVESNTGNFESSSNTGSNPMSPDSDTDSFGDAEEVVLGTDPNSALSRTPLPPGVTLSVLTDDASTGISTEHTYTHKVSGGYGTTVNGVTFDALTAAVTPVNLTWDASGGKNVIGPPANNGDWQPANGGVTGAGLTDLLGGFTYSGGGAGPGSTQRFTLSGLTPGLTYEAKLFIRVWDTEGGGRPIDLTFTNGAEVAAIWPGHHLPEDRPGGVTTTGNSHAAYAISFTYVAQGATLLIDANVPAGVAADSGSFHMYAMTNREAGPPPVLDFTNIARAANGSSTTLTWASRPGRIYKVEFSTDLVTWLELTDAHQSGGTSTTYVDDIASNFARAQYKVTDVTP